VNFLVIINGWRDSTIRGGDYHILRILSCWGKEHRISFIMPNLGYQSSRFLLGCENSIFLSSREECKETVNPNRLLFLSYLKRTLRSLFFRSKHHIDIVIAPSHRLYDLVPAVFLCRKLKCGLIVYVHHLFLSFRKPKDGIWYSVSLLIENISLLLCRNADLVFVVNLNTKDMLISKGLPENKIVLTHNGVNLSFIDSVKVHAQVFDCCFCGPLVKEKGVYDLLDMWKMVLKYFPESRLVIIGQGSEYGKLRKMINDNLF
jgi:glycosyltransferase involved in cell wall biosynthesis